MTNIWKEDNPKNVLVILCLVLLSTNLIQSTN